MLSFEVGPLASSYRRVESGRSCVLSLIPSLRSESENREHQWVYELRCFACRKSDLNDREQMKKRQRASAERVNGRCDWHAFGAVAE